MSRRSLSVFCLLAGLSLAGFGCGASGLNGSVVDGSNGTESGSPIADNIPTVLPPAPAPTAEVCNDGIDNDGNGATDCADFICYSDPACAAPAPTAEICGDGIDNDGNGSIDCEDAACSSDSACAAPAPTPEICGDGIDNDGNGDTDCDDAACAETNICLMKHLNATPAVTYTKGSYSKVKVQYGPACVNCPDPAFNRFQEYGPGDKERSWNAPTVFDN